MPLSSLDISFAKTDPVSHPPLRWIKKLEPAIQHLLHKLAGGGGGGGIAIELNVFTSSVSHW